LPQTWSDCKWKTASLASIPKKIMEPVFLEATSEGHKDDWEQTAEF